MQRKRHINFKDFLIRTSDSRISKLHSIPILIRNSKRMKKSASLDNNSKKSNVLYSIPCVKSCARAFCRIRFKSTFVILCLSIIGLASLIGGNKCYATTSASLELGNTNLSATATQGNTSYLSSTIKATASDIESYTLSITGPVGLSSTNGSTITGANNNKPSMMPNNSWGYAYNDSNSNENKTYKSFTGSAQTLESGTTPSGMAKNITFAAKFSDDAVAAHYTAQVHINLVATPKATTTAKWLWSTDDSIIGIDSGINYMQEMTPEVCNQVSTPVASATPGATKAPTLKLIDSRDDNEYTIAKLPDGKCWMVENLRLLGETNKVNPNFPNNNSLTSNDTNLTENSYLLPKTISNLENHFDTDDSNKAVSYYSDRSLAGATVYYTWTAVNAGSIITSGNAISDICPKGWRLPSGGTTSDNEFRDLLNSMDIGTMDSGGGTTSLSGVAVSVIRNKPYNMEFTGFLRAGSEQSFEGLGAWWSSTATYFLYVNTALTFAGNGNAARYDGQAARCIAK